MRYAEWKKGTAAIKPVPLPVNRQPGDETEAPQVGLKPFDGDTQLLVLARARAMAVAKGVADPKADDPIYNFGVQVHTVALGTVDPDDPTRPFFADADELLGAPDLGPDGILMLAEQHDLWQAEVSPQITKLDDGDYGKMLAQVCGPEGADFFARWRPSLRWIFTRTTVAQLQTLLTFKSLSGLSDGDDATSTDSEPSNNSNSADG